MKTTKQMVSELRIMQRQIIHGKNTFGEIADRLESQELLCAELLEACKNLVEQFHAYRAGWSGQPWGDRVGLPSDLEKAHAAIAKAEGRPN